MKFKEFIFILEFISGDFGLSVSVTDLLNKSDIIEGDSKYLAPELLDRQCDAKADIFRFFFCLWNDAIIFENWNIELQPSRLKRLGHFLSLSRAIWSILGRSCDKNQYFMAQQLKWSKVWNFSVYCVDYWRTNTLQKISFQVCNYS